MGTIKISILEKDGEELSQATEMDLAAALSYIGISDGGFSRKKILSGELVTIPINQEMIVTRQITILGELAIRGELTIL